MKFEEYRLSNELKRNLDEMGFKRPTDIQFKCIPPVQRGEDVLAIAQTGTGKTGAFAIPVIDKIQHIKQKSRSNAVRGLIMVPTRELAVQITEVFQSLGKNTKVKTISIYGGVEQEPQIQKLLNGVDIVVSTPGRMFDLVSQGYLKLDKIEVLILDEADQMLALGFYKDITDLIRFLPKKRQTLFFSATIDKNIKKLAYSLVRDAIRIHISPKDPVSKNVNHRVVFVEMDDKRFFLQRLINEHPEEKFLVFVRTKVRAERVKAALERLEVDADTIHGDKEQDEREDSLRNFAEGKSKVLIATDVSARGIDIPHVDYVINYDLPEQPENYVHRVGRTGRGRNKGEALAFCAKQEKPLLEAIEAYTTVPINRAVVSKSDYQETLEIESEFKADWRSLMNQVQAPKKKKKKK
jgi:ATP-dependent RNA helicase RhlE